MHTIIAENSAVTLRRTQEIKNLISEFGLCYVYLLTFCVDSAGIVFHDRLLMHWIADPAFWIGNFDEKRRLFFSILNPVIAFCSTVTGRQ